MIVNPTAGRRRRWRIRATIAELERLGAAVIVATTSKPGEAEHFAARADQREHDLLVIAGGDGSINEAITGLGPAAPPLGILPAGTANVVAAEIGMSATPGAIARTLLNGPARTIGLGRANGRRFLTMVGAGLDAKVVAALRPELKRWFGKGAYVLETANQIMRLHAPCYHITLDGTALSEAAAIVVNGRFYAGRHPLAPAGSLAEPGLFACLFNRADRMAAVGYGLALITDRLPAHPAIRLLPAGRMRIEGVPGEPVQLDGDIRTTLPLDIEAEPDAIELVFPEIPVRQAPRDP
jgi:YegS/Rv2252/BmrU family lipid kinase